MSQEHGTDQELNQAFDRKDGTSVRAYCHGIETWFPASDCEFLRMYTSKQLVRKSYGNVPVIDIGTDTDEFNA